MNWWHSRPDEAMEWWANEIGASAYAALRLRAGKPRKTNYGLIKVYLESERAKL